ncbi:peroxiredoxin family protein [Streptomyces sp. NBC_01236]|uniref:peroxiredoxin family protein n=1 Tax=Streptomyces sp. NBC_01236 TaxID=2903789 RepID=UPI002E0D4672|nr:peroxiredoxin family protein [Streptomyces sp. NBC_01236]
MAADTQHETKAARRARLAQERERQQHREERRRRVRNLSIAAVVVIAVIAGLYTVFNRSDQSSTASGYEVGSPGIGKTAPAFTLTSSNGKATSLTSFKGKTVLLYFQEGLTCQPCWDQIHDLEKNAAKVKAAGVDQIVSITSDPANLIARKVKDENLATPVLSDPDLKVSKAYEANQYGMMGTSRDGHSFVLVGPDGKIQWRADYGGAPKYTMFVKVDKLLTDLKAGRKS